ncbi:hypothetical protein GF1_15980 [Desulfolithobacter dissulfuricans]|uniref:DGQHR domain-containing protein n=1 Tax=Desulfolithobacter dissulfuricans TaxID=2795293 RepID=A0A915XJX6_9BACT|nr:DNA sulfur modification protein DndB [Desulfolithobacter dissulfuricans]BCO09222.1 hypothetical protein GF1_15980 [Desulfolithobacter dissulfuricans]
MEDVLELQEESALDLTLSGTTGSFQVGSGLDDQHSIEVKYLLTHVGLDFSTGSAEALLDHLAPVREIFTFESLGFDEIMQRDIDDARVSSELIPYLLDEKSRDLIKLFPPIVVVVLPAEENENKPADKYPFVDEFQVEGKNGKPGRYILRSGNVGQEVFEFEQPILSGKLLKHDKVRLRLNTKKTRLVIVDGQHRAMALLALYRNLKERWSDEKRAPFKEYYSEWTQKYIQKFSLKEINLPVMLCTFPTLDERYSGEFDLKKAARSIFLTLNKTARKVSNSRNILLDDKDLIAYFLRATLSEIKNKDDRSRFSLRIFNVELDQFRDKVKIQSPIALTGVNHIYYIIEHLMLNDGYVSGIAPRTGKFSNRKDLNSYVCMERLDGRNLLGADVANITTRDNFSQSTAETLQKSFMHRYGNFIIACYEQFRPFLVHSSAVLDLETKLEVHEDRTLKPILFEGQGMSRVFYEHRKNLKTKLKNREFSTDVPKIEAIAKRLDATAERIQKSLESFQRERASLFFKNVTDKRKLKKGDDLLEQIVFWLNDLYENVLTTVAFQSALICAFFTELDKTNTKLDKISQNALDTDSTFDEYIGQINDFFTPKTSSQFRKLVSVFTGDFQGEIADWKIVKTPSTFRNVVYRGEMQPDQWPKYKYLILEIWNPTNSILNKNISQERYKCQRQIFSSLYNSIKADHCLKNSKLEENLTKDELHSIFDLTYNNYRALLKNIGSSILPKKEMKEAVSAIPATADDTVEDDQLWMSVPSE